MLELKSKRKVFFQRNKNMIENVQSPLCLKLLKISSPKNRFFIKANRELELVREQGAPDEPLHRTSCSLTCPSCSFSLADLIHFPSMLYSHNDGHHYHGPHAPLSQPGLCSSSWQSDPKGNSPRPRSMVWYTALPFSFRYQLSELRFQFQCNKIINRTFVFLSLDWF